MSLTENTKDTRPYHRIPLAKSVKHLQSIGVYDEWETPNSHLKFAMMEYDILPFLDVCATPENTKFREFFTKEQNALLQDWKLNFFMNPPYSRVTEFMEKALNESRKNNVDGLCLVYAKTNTRWWHKYVEAIAEVHFIKGRIKFLHDGIPSKNSAPYSSAWIIYRSQK